MKFLKVAEPWFCEVTVQGPVLISSIDIPGRHMEGDGLEKFRALKLSEPDYDPWV